jgi:ribosome-associated protein
VEFKIRTDYIELDNLLKAADLVSSGAQAKHLIQAGIVKVNGIVETKVRKKLQKGDSVDIEGKKILIV